ncbi:MAG: TaqI-like C-terminal specificity domain-containing protein, partial [Anaerolineae bacterium]|nr:TaqI-like C-terminal specificity domain-containing protein [Anaerolineae bacterium]
WVANFGENQPFKDAEMVYPSIAVMRSGKAKKTFKHYFMDGNVPYLKMGDTFKEAEWVNSLSNVTEMDEWRFQAKELTELFKKITIKNSILEQIVNNQIFYGIKTGFNDAFFIDSATRQRLIDEHPKSIEIIKPLVRGQDLRPWYQENSGLHLIFTNRGIAIDEYPAVRRYLEQYKNRLEPKPSDWSSTQENWQGRAGGNYKWYELQGSISYSHVLENNKIFWPDIAKLPRFSLDTARHYANDKGCMIVPNNMAILAILNSRVIWFTVSQMATPLRLRAGLWQYQAKIQFVKRLPIPELTATQESDLATIAETITSYAQERYQAHENMRQIISSDFGSGTSISSRIDLYQWWNFDNADALNDDLGSTSRRNAGFSEIPLSKRSEWRKFFADEKAKHSAITDKIISEETRMNEIVYEAFGLDTAERQLIEAATKYPYGAV